LILLWPCWGGWFLRREPNEIGKHFPQDRPGHPGTSRSVRGTRVCTVEQPATFQQRPPGPEPRPAAMQTIGVSWFVALLDESVAASLVEVELTHLAAHKVGNRPDRVEPRAVKRRPKQHRLLTKPRDEARADLLGERVAVTP